MSVTGGPLLGRSRREAEQLVATLRHGATTTFGAAKALVAGAAGRGPVDQLAVETETVTAASVSPQGREGVDAFMAKRTPDFGWPRPSWLRVV